MSRKSNLSSFVFSSFLKSLEISGIKIEEASKIQTTGEETLSLLLLTKELPSAR